MNHETCTLYVKRLEPGAKLPTIGHPGEDNAYDLYALETTDMVPGRIYNLRTGIAAEQTNCGFLVVARSSMSKHQVVGIAGLIDAGYRGEWHMIFHCFQPYTIKAGDRVGQAIPVPNPVNRVQEVEELTPSSRGVKGFGSTGL